MWKKMRLHWIVLLILFIGMVLQVQADPADKGVIGESAYVEQEEGEALITETAVKNPHHVTATNDVYLPIIIKPNLLSPEAQAVVDLVNVERVNAGCAPLQAQEQLVTAAQGHSEDMAVNDYFSHTSLDGRSPWDRIHATGYTYWTAGENIAAGYSTASAAVTGWMNSSGHRANILNCNFTETGVGYYYLQNDTGSSNWHHYWTQVFASPN